MAEMSMDTLDADLESACWRSFRNHWFTCRTCRIHDWSRDFTRLCREGQRLGAVWLMSLDRLNESDEARAHAEDMAYEAWRDYQQESDLQEER